MRGPRHGALAAAFLLLALAAGSAVAEVRTCADCYLGVYDDQAMTRSSGQVGFFQVKSVYLGVRLAAEVRISDLEFEATYPGGFTVIDYDSFISGARITPTATGVRVEWPQCVSGTRALFRVRVFSLSSVRNATVQLRNATSASCPGGPANSWRIPAGCYVLNPSGPPTACAVGVEPSSWSTVKELFR
jgi:hypothetical protein